VGVFNPKDPQYHPNDAIVQECVPYPLVLFQFADMGETFLLMARPP
jgi:hypothetical protein